MEVAVSERYGLSLYPVSAANLLPLYSSTPPSSAFLVAHRHFRLLHLVPVDSSHSLSPPHFGSLSFISSLLLLWTLEGLARGIEKVEGNGAHLESEIQQVPPPLLGHPSTGVLSLRGRGFDSPVRRVIPFRPRRSARWGWERETEKEPLFHTLEQRNWEWDGYIIRR